MAQLFLLLLLSTYFNFKLNQNNYSKVFKRILFLDLEEAMDIENLTTEGKYYVLFSLKIMFKLLNQIYITMICSC